MPLNYSMLFSPSDKKIMVDKCSLDTDFRSLFAKFWIVELTSLLLFLLRLSGGTTQGWSNGGENEKTEVFSSTGAGMMTSPSLILNIVDEISR